MIFVIDTIAARMKKATICLALLPSADATLAGSHIPSTGVGYISAYFPSILRCLAKVSCPATNKCLPTFAAVYWLVPFCHPRSNQVAQWALSQGLGKSDAIALVMPSCPDYGKSKIRVPTYSLQYKSSRFYR